MIKSLLDQILEDELMIRKISVSVAGKEVKMKKCSFCEKTVLTDSGLKAHITQMHKEPKRKRNITEDDNNEIKVIDETIDDSMEVTLNQTLDKNLPKKYSNKCDNCDFVAQATRKYIALQAIKAHREYCEKTWDKNNLHCRMCKF